MANREDEIAELKRRLAELEGATDVDLTPQRNPAATGRPYSKKRPRSIKARFGLSTSNIIVGIVAVCIIAIFLPLTLFPAKPAGSVPQGHRYDSETQRLIAEEASGTLSPDPSRSDWEYRDDADPMTDQLTRRACTTSTNMAYLDRPYEPVTASLCLRQSPRHGVDVIVFLNGDGQIICRSYRDCSVKVRFDDGPAQSFSAADAADGSSNVIFITNASRFIGSAKGAKVTQVELLFYQAGNQTLKFPTANLVWPRPEGAQP